MFKDIINSITTKISSNQEPQESLAPQAEVNRDSGAPNQLHIKHELKMGRETYAVLEGENLLYVAKLKMFAIKEQIGVYKDEAATQLVFTIDQAKAVAISKVYEVVSAEGEKIGGFKQEAMQSINNQQWDILDINDNPIGSINQNIIGAVAGRIGTIGTLIPQTFVATINGQQVGVYKEEEQLGLIYKMNIDFSSDASGVYDRTLGIAGAILLASKHNSTS